jgi:RNA polymerase sigma-70 factor, ECF subfamily
MPATSELIVRAQADDQQAMEQIIVTYQARVAAMVISIVGRDDDWEDICQQVFVKMVLRLRQLKQIETFEPWLFRIVRNAALDHLRRRRARRFLVPWLKSHESIAGAPDPELNLNNAALDTAIAQLPPDERELIALIRDQHCNYSRLSGISGHSVSAIKSRLFRVRRRVRQLMLGA